ncbi:uncharacterized protein K452DRAFT_60169 [Aplosporella prunicola CBS 121167]|uniref:Uncharacterized protein n=1 Tax=Aplosporella prunicola CBS 121167 TaxID=1176127 RepID=A0A6A6B906_9PEZI|nr:uncharacterized protein K452DRAFT_60169 [Aplosporella prunicola CBS 121167]KAF2140058.1 hypothetical protein K452DRAFT_60169 [Aplosporella prunicola CBS 121167]
MPPAPMKTGCARRPCALRLRINESWPRGTVKGGSLGLFCAYVHRRRGPMAVLIRRRRQEIMANAGGAGGNPLGGLFLFLNLIFFFRPLPISGVGDTSPGILAGSGRSRRRTGRNWVNGVWKNLKGHSSGPFAESG